MLSNLRFLAWTLCGVSLGIWFCSLVGGRLVCRQALRPISRMAESARDMNAADLSTRLPLEATGDQLEDLSRSFNSLLARLHESFERQRRFTGDASHQLRTPLTAILGQIEVALRRHRGVEEYQRVLTSVQNQATHLRQIVESLLFLARADEEARLAGLETIELGNWAKQYQQSLSEHARARDIRIESDLAPPAFVRVQPVMFGELVNVLIENACKYSSPGTPVTLRVESGGSDRVQLTIEDCGCGIEESDLPHVFEPFYRSPHALRQVAAGVGLGLAIAKRLAETFGGSLAVRSTLGKGSIFTISLRAVPPLHENGAMKNLAEEPAGIAAPAIESLFHNPRLPGSDKSLCKTPTSRQNTPHTD
jgi:signal transduction histidine kinase